MMKLMRCNRCNKDKPEGEFSWQNKQAGVKNRRCKDCQKEMKDDWYVRNRDTVLDNQRMLRAATTGATISSTSPVIYSNSSCSTCGEADPIVLTEPIRGMILCANDEIRWKVRLANERRNP